MESNTYAISSYHDVQDIYRRLNSLVSQPLRPLRRDKKQEVMDYFEQKCAKSRALNDEAKKFIPGGVQHNLAFNYPFPIAVERADGAYLWDVDGNQYIDFLQAGGPTVLGSNYKPVRDKVIELLQSCGPVTGLFHEYELKLAQLVCRFMPANEMFRMLGSGTELVMAAIRAARAFTKHSKVIKVGGAYHGWSELDGIRSAYTWHRSFGGERYTVWSQFQHAGVLSKFTLCSEKAIDSQPCFRWYSGSHRRTNGS